MPAVVGVTENERGRLMPQGPGKGKRPFCDIYGRTRSCVLSSRAAAPSAWLDAGTIRR
ncbi:hypothetical protein ACFOHY_22330 [Rhizobium rosettiformans]|uniref:hypothetical protein n=1 Tax=Rhizobium rosettiformans TaxID=1368430 RepID=UPI0026C57C83